jgi:phospho-N-acetylmuramoyl-pentapeptide-transferase
MLCPPFSPELLNQGLLYLIFAAVGAFFWAPLLTKILYKYKITRRGEFDFTLRNQERATKIGTPIMGGVLIILTVTIITILFNWEREYTFVPIGVMAISSLLGAADDILNIYGKKRRSSRTISQIIKLIRVHKNPWMRVWKFITLPIAILQRLTSFFGSHPGKGILVHEKLFFQFIAGAVTAWWIYFKLGTHWHSLWIPFGGELYLGWGIIVLVILIVMFTANAVNIADGLDGLAGGSLIITFLGLTVISWAEGQTAFTLLNATVVGASITYTYFNIKPARFQMGDVGSLGLGALLAINTIAINKTLIIPLLGFIFYVEAISVIIQVFSKKLLGRRWLKMAPLHHHFEFRGWREEKIVMRFWLIHAFFVIVAVWLSLN